MRRFYNRQGPHCTGKMARNNACQRKQRILCDQVLNSLMRKNKDIAIFVVKSLIIFLRTECVCQNSLHMKQSMELGQGKHREFGNKV